MLNIIKGFFELPRSVKRAITLSTDAIFVVFAFYAALYIRVGSQWTEWLKPDIYFLLSFLLIGSIFIWVRLGLYRAIIRYLDMKVLTNIFWGTIGSVLLMLIGLFAFGIALPRTVPFIYATLILISIAGSRLIVRGLVNTQTNRNKIPVLIYGAGASGRQLCLSLQNGHEYKPVAFVDDNTAIQGNYVTDLMVFPPSKLKLLIDGLKVDKVLFAIPSISADAKRAIFNKVRMLNVEMLTIPGTAELVSGKFGFNQLKSVQIEDLLGREEIHPSSELLRKCIFEKNVFVSGAGGSIGSELCRQIVKHSPKTLILFELSEFNLYAIESEISKLAAETKIVPIMGSVQDKRLLEQVFDKYQIHTVYHAAAYKHVPLVEYNIARGVLNNIWGTLRLAEVSFKHKVNNFVLISTDKAVRPTNVMGTTKRVAELIVQDLASRTEHSTFCMVRFGNVLGSSGSVIPLFRKQIENGGPITVTHPEITRYFMTIPEAATLVIQAGAMAEGGDVFVLDMGAPVKITDLATKMVQLMGSTVRNDDNPDGDIEISYSGLRPGEKLYEELLIGGNVLETNHPRIMKANEITMSSKDLQQLLDNLKDAVSKNDMHLLVNLLQEAPTGFAPSSPVCDILGDKPVVKFETHDNVTKIKM